MKKNYIYGLAFTIGCILLGFSSVVVGGEAPYRGSGEVASKLAEEELPQIGYSVQVESDLGGELVLRCALDPDSVCDL